MVPTLKPDVISMDVRMPRLDGLAATRRLMTRHPTPVVVVSALVEDDIDLSLRALEAGALAVVSKPPDRNNPSFEENQRTLIRTLSGMARVSLVRRGKADTPGQFDTGEYQVVHATPEIIAIGASAGGPSALSRLLAGLPADLPVPVVVAQHMPHEFVPGLARWLDKATPLAVRIAVNELILKPGVVHLSPGTAHLSVVRRQDTLVAQLNPEKGMYRYQPSVDVLFESVAMACGNRALGMVLTGMGDDGAEGLLAMREVGARTIAQDQVSSTVFGMPNAAIERGAVESVISLAEMPSAILDLL